jgi:hypothetical protein
MNRHTVFGRTIQTALAIRLAAVLAAGLLALAVIAPLALSGRTAAPSRSVASSASPRTSGGSNSLSPAASTTSTFAADASIPAFPDVSADASPTTGYLLPGEIGLAGGIDGGKLLIKFRDVTEVADPVGLKPSAPGDVFLEATVDMKALTDTPLMNVWKTFGGEELGVDSVWPKPYLVLPDTLAAGETVSGKLGFEVPPTGEVTVLFPGGIDWLLRLELRPAPTGPTPSPVAPDGWPVTLDGNGPTTLGSDGTVYYGDLVLNSSGHLVSDRHFALPGVSTGLPAAIGADGTIYVEGMTPDQSKTVIGAFTPDGTLRAGWPVSVDGFVNLVSLPSGGIYSYPYSNVDSGVRLYGADGTLRESWPNAFGNSAVLGTGDSLYALAVDPNGSAGHVAVMRADGSRASGTATDWQDIRVAPDGTVYAWTWVLATGSDTTVITTRIAAIGADGNPKAGWPVSIKGSASTPAFGADGTLYLTLGPSGATSSVLALDPFGHTKAGWPVKLPSGYTALSDGGAWHWPDIAQAPTLGADGTLYVAAETTDGKPLLAAFDAGGRVEAGWPYRPPSSFTRFGNAVGGYINETPPLFARSGSGGLLYLVLKDRIIALSGDGKVAPGWPKELTGVTAWAATPDGGLVAEVGWYDAGNNPHTTITRWTAAGDIAH